MSKSMLYHFNNVFLQLKILKTLFVLWVLFMLEKCLLFVMLLFADVLKFFVEGRIVYKRKHIKLKSLQKNA